MTTETQAALIIQHLRAHQAAYLRLAETHRLEGQAAEDPYLMGKACAYREAASALEASILTVEAGAPARKPKLEIVS